MRVPNKRDLLSSLIGMLLLSASVSASAVLVQFEQNHLGGIRYENTYTVTNDDLVSGIDALSIFFEYDSYDNLVITGSPVDWDPLVLPPEPGFLLDGIADWFSFGPTIDLGNSSDEFSVSYDWIGVGTSPFDTQYFEVYDTFTFDLLSDGIATRVTPTTNVSEPSIFSLMIIASLILLRSGRSKR